MTPQDREEHRLAALGAGFDYDCIFGSPAILTNGEYTPWHPKTSKADSFDLLYAIYKYVSANPTPWSETPTHLQEGWETLQEAFYSGDSLTACEAVFNLAVAIGRDKEGEEE